ncbi:MAG TPA: MFS transporter, partial [Thermomicrobiales bacterium]|nr:MFS transporter [Thermomicrobiales bacterium]
AVLLLAFVAWQTQARQPLVDLRLFRDSMFSGGMVSMVLVMFVMYGLLFTLPLYLQGVRGEDALGSGLWLTPMMAGIIVAAVSSKSLLGRVGVRIGIVAGLLVGAGALIALARVEVDTPMVWFGAGLAVFGLGLGVAMTSAMDAVLGTLPRDRAGAGSGVVNAMRQVAGALGVAILGSVLSSLYRDNLDDAVLHSLPAEAPAAVRESIIAANAVASTLGADGEVVRRMGGAGYTDAMAGVLWISALDAVGAAIISAVVVPGRRIAEGTGTPTRSRAAGTYE